jgi:hypothetical protein
VLKGTAFVVQFFKGVLVMIRELGTVTEQTKKIPPKVDFNNSLQP